MLKELENKWSEWQSHVGSFGEFGLEVESVHHEFAELKQKLRHETLQYRKQYHSDEVEHVQFLLKSYQVAVDALSKRAKRAESQFLQLFQASLKVPEIHWAFESIRELSQESRDHSSEKGERINELSSLLSKERTKNKVLKERIEELEEEFTRVKNQDVTVRRLEEELNSQKDAEVAAIESARMDRDQHWQQALMEIREVHEKEKNALKHRLEGVERERWTSVAREQQMEAAMSQLKNERDEKISSHIGRIQILTYELERSKEHVPVQSSDGTNAAIDIQDDPDQSVTTSDPQASYFSSPVHASKVAALEDKVKFAQSALAATKLQHSEAIEGLHKKLESYMVESTVLKGDIMSLQAELAQRPLQEDFDKVKQQLKNIDIVNYCIKGGAETDLELRLLQRQQALEGECAVLRASLEEKSNALVQVQHDKRLADNQLFDALEQVEKLNQQVDLTTTADAASKTALGRDDGFPVVRPLRFETISTHRNGPSEATNLSVGGGEAVSGEQSTNAFRVHEQVSLVGSSKISEFDSIAWQQRERYRTRLLEVEQKRDEWKYNAARERRRADRLQGDNVTLLERIRYMEMYAGQRPVGKADRGGDVEKQQPTASVLLGGDGPHQNVPVDLYDRYRDAYDDDVTNDVPGFGQKKSVDPFANFRIAEKIRRLGKMSPPERALVFFTNAVSSSRVLRVVAVLYTVLMHLLVGACVMRLSSFRNCGEDQ